MGAKLRVRSDFPDVSVNPVVQQPGGREKGKDNLVSKVHIASAEFRLQDEARHHVKNRRIGESTGEISEPPAIDQCGQSVLAALMRLLAVLVLVVEPYQAVILDVVKNSGGSIYPKQRHVTPEKQEIDGNGCRKQDLLRPVQCQTLAPLHKLARHIYERDQDKQEKQEVFENGAGARRKREGKQRGRL